MMRSKPQRAGGGIQRGATRAQLLRARRDPADAAPPAARYARREQGLPKTQATPCRAGNLLRQRRLCA
eukprot:6857042-Prymnesium_polylepis.1